MTWLAPRFQVLLSILSRHAAPQLQATRVGRQRGAGGSLGGVVCAQHDDVAARQLIAPVQLGIPAGRLLRLEVRLQLLLAAAAGGEEGVGWMA